MSTSIAGGGMGARSAERVPTASRAAPAASAFQARRRSRSAIPLSSRATGPRAERLAAQSAAVATSAVSSSTPPACASISRRTRASRSAPTNSSGVSARLPDHSQALGMGSPGRTGGSSAALVEPSDEQLSAEIHRAKSSWERDMIGPGSSAAASGLTPAVSSARSPTTTPGRTAPPRGAWTRCPGTTVRCGGTE